MSEGPGGVDTVAVSVDDETKSLPECGHDSLGEFDVPITDKERLRIVGDETRVPVVEPRSLWMWLTADIGAIISLTDSQPVSLQIDLCAPFERSAYLLKRLEFAVEGKDELFHTAPPGRFAESMPKEGRRYASLRIVPRVERWLELRHRRHPVRTED
jgi:hypothetical protein